jgi:hypothetical protein
LLEVGGVVMLLPVRAYGVQFFVLAECFSIILGEFTAADVVFDVVHDLVQGVDAGFFASAITEDV